MEETVSLSVVKVCRRNSCSSSCNIAIPNKIYVYHDVINELKIAKQDSQYSLWNAYTHIYISHQGVKYPCNEC